MDFDATWLLLSLIPSGAGFVLLVYGKQQGRWPHMVAGLLFTLYPYFTSSLTALVGIGVAIGLGFFDAIQSGW